VALARFSMNKERTARKKTCNVTGKFRQADRVHKALITDQVSPDRSKAGPLIEFYRQELLVHCYRLLGSLSEAEDAVQETMLRAWRHLDTFKEQGPGSLRAWLYKIATNSSLDLLKKHSERRLPTTATPAWDPHRPIAKRETEALWLEPFPTSWLAEATENLEARYSRQESVSLAFLTALQLLPPRQRAILLLSDVLDYRASEIAHLLEISVGAVKSALHRARVTLEKNYPNEKREMAQVRGTDVATNALLARYLQAWETDDVDGLVALLKEDATFSMPPVPSWYQGREAIRTILLAAVFPSGVQKQWRLYLTRANGQPAVALYRADEATGVYRAFGIQVITLDDVQFPRQIAEVTAFLGQELVTSFGFPLQLPQSRHYPRLAPH
jgi:RNA polymerase sigma-70 factor (ECF subfamily)